MLQRIVAVVLLGTLGLVAGLAVTYSGGYRYKVVSTPCCPPATVLIRLPIWWP